MMSSVSLTDLSTDLDDDDDDDEDKLKTYKQEQTLLLAAERLLKMFPNNSHLGLS